MIPVYVSVGVVNLIVSILTPIYGARPERVFPMVAFFIWNVIAMPAIYVYQFVEIKESATDMFPGAEPSDLDSLSVTVTVTLCVGFVVRITLLVFTVLVSRGFGFGLKDRVFYHATPHDVFEPSAHVPPSVQTSVFDHESGPRTALLNH